MNDIIDSELAESKSLDLSMVLKWILVGILGCIVFQSLEVFLQRILLSFIENEGIFSGNTSFLLSELIAMILLLIIFYNLIEGFKKRYYKNNIDIRKTLIRLVIFYVAINVLQAIVIQLIYSNPRGEGIDPLENYYILLQVFFITETFLKYGVVAWILLKK